ncbi:MAG TPA: GAF domain-containing protein, partial [Chloroflexi bacterium]|nr:GAF domain-containing protein [Chloroflexota bacterium]
GLDYFSKNRVDVAIVDIGMPRMGGLEMLEKCREISDDFVSIIITGHGDHERAVRALQLGVFNYLRKPISLEELVIAVGKGIEFLHLRRGLAARRRELEIETALKEQYAQNLEKMVEERTEEIRHLNWVLRAVRSVSQLITRERDPERLLAEACKILLATRDYRMVWIGLVEEGSKRVLPAARAGQGTGYLDEVTITWDETETGQGPTGTALRTRRPAVMRHIATDPRYAPWRDAARVRGYESSVAVPMVHAERLFGVLNVYAATPDAFDDEEVTLLQELANDLAFALQSIEDEAARVRAEEALRFQATLLAQISDSITATDLEGRITYVNQASAQAVGRSPEELIGQSVELFGEDPARGATQREIIECTRRDGQWRGQVVNFRPDGSEVIFDTRTWVLYDDVGQPTGLCGISTDVTEQVWSEKMLRALNAAAAAVQRAACTPEAVFTAVMEQLQALGLTGAVTLLDEERKRFTIRYAAVTSQALAQAEQLTGRKAVGYTFPVEQLPIGQQVLAGEAVFVPDVAALLAPVVPAPVRSLMSKAMRLLNMPRGVVAPLSIEGEIIGFLGVSAARMTEADVPTITAFANQMAAALESARLFEAEQRRQQELEALREVSLAITAQLELDALLQNMVEQGCRLLGVKAGSVYLVDETRGDLELIVSYGYTRDYSGTRLAPGEGLAGRVLQSSEPLAVDDYQHWEGRSPDWEAEPITGCVGVPLKCGERVIGVLDFAEVARPRSFDEHDVWLATLFASQAAIAIENACLFTSLAQEKERLGLLHRLSQRISEGLDVRQVAQQALDEVCAVVGALSGVAIVREPDSDRLRLVAVSGYDAESVEALDQRLRLRLGEGLAGWVAAQRQPALVDDVTRDEHWMPVSGLDDWVRSALSVPLVSGDEVVGVFSIYGDREAFFNDEHRQLAESAAAPLALAIANARLFQAERGQRELAEALEAAAAAVSSTLEPDEVLDRILEQVERVVAGDAFNVMLVEDGKARVVRWWGYERLDTEERVAGSAIPVTEYPNLLRMVQRGEPVVVPDTAADPDWVLVGGREWLRSYVGAPIRVRGLTVGFLNVDSAQPGRFGPADGRRLQAFADHAAIAIENAQLYRELRGHAERLEERVREQTAAIQAQYARLEAILRSTSDGIIVTDGEGEVVQANPVARGWLSETLRPEEAARLREAV